MMWLHGWRDSAWSELDRKWDVIVIGGGITGAGIFREVASAGLKVLLLEAKDFASGTSSRSSKLVHGGLRYLRNGQIGIAYSSIRERQRMLGNGKGLVLPLEFLFAIYTQDKLPRWKFASALSLYDILAMRWDHRWYGAAKLLKLEPKLSQSNLIGGYRYMDAKADDARLVLRIISEGVSFGGLALNYAPVKELLRDIRGTVRGVAAKDSSPENSGRTIELRARIVINATGASADAIRYRVGGRPKLRILKGSHLVFPHSRLPLARAVGFVHPENRRPIFALPWEGVTVYGTTDIDYPAGDRGEPAINSAEIDYLMTGIRGIFPDLNLDTADIQATFSGVRVVVDTGEENPSKESRDHAIWQDSGMLTVAGGKLTTYRVIARDALKVLMKRLRGTHFAAQTQVLKTPENIMLSGDLPSAIKARLSGRHGIWAADLVAGSNVGEMMPIDPLNPESPLLAELRWAARNEAVVHLEDLLLRRTRLGLLLPQGALAIIEKIRFIVQPELQWTDVRWEEEKAAYSALWQSTYSPII
jgi:glycerol-3-phosphate dehydrogenase